MRSLVLVGYGSHAQPETARALYDHAEYIRQQGIFSEVVEAFWQEEPSLRQVLRCTRYTDVTIVPMFHHESYLTQVVLPRELNLGHTGKIPPEGITRHMGTKTVHYTLPYGVHPKMVDVIVARAMEAYPEANPQDTALMVLAQGSNRTSANTITHHAQHIAALGLFREVQVLFLQQEPKHDTWQHIIRSPHVVVVPVLSARDGGEPISQTFKHPSETEQTLHFALPVGTHPHVADIVLELAKSVSERTSASGEVDKAQHQAWQALISQAMKGMVLGEVVIGYRAGLFEMRHVLDSARDDLELLVAPESLRDKVRFADTGAYRPVHTFRTLPRGWRAVFNDHDFSRAIHYVYPAVVEETALYEEEQLRYVPWMTTARRQTGVYREVQKAPLDVVQQVAKQTCGQCLKTCLWLGRNLNTTFFEGTAGGMPCTEACSYFIARVKEHL